MRRFFTPLIYLVALSLLLPLSGHAVTTAPKAIKATNSFSLSPTAGGFMFSSARNLETAPSYGLRLSFDHIGRTMVDSIGLEATVNKFSSSEKNSDKKVEGLLFRTDAIYSISARTKWVPFFALGAGGMFLDREGVRDNSPFINFGIGLKYFFEDWLALRADLRQLMVYNNVDTTNDFELSTSLTYIFGKERKKKAKPVPPKPKPTAPAVPVIEEPPIEEAPQLQPPAPLPLPPAAPSIFDILGAAAGYALGIHTLPPQFDAAWQPIAPPITPPKAAPAPVPAPAPAPVGAVEPAQEPAPAPQAEPVRKRQKQVKQLTVEFQFSSPEVPKSYGSKIAEIAALIMASTEWSAVVEGHTDSVGKSAPNVILSLKRAESVKKELAKYGIDVSKIVSKGYGFTRPKASNKTELGRQRNRRAVAVVTLTTTYEVPAGTPAAPEPSSLAPVSPEPSSLAPVSPEPPSLAPVSPEPPSLAPASPAPADDQPAVHQLEGSGKEPRQQLQGDVAPGKQGAAKAKRAKQQVTGQTKPLKRQLGAKSKRLKQQAGAKSKRLKQQAGAKGKRPRKLSRTDDNSSKRQTVVGRKRPVRRNRPGA